jgi:anti-anti-sigma factor
MELTMNENNGIKVINLKGHLDGNTSPKVQEEIMPIIQSGTKIVINMADCDYVSSAGLRLLLVIAKTLKSKGGKGVISGLLPEVKDVMEMTGFDRMYENYSSVDDAIKALNEG